MNRINDTPENTRQRGRLVLQYTVLLLIVLPIYALLNVGYVILSSNVIYYGSALCYLMELLCNLTNVAMFFTSFAVLIYFLWNWGVRESIRILTTYFVSLLCKYLLILLFIYLFDGFPSDGRVLASDLLSALYNILTEALEYILVFFIAYFIFRKEKQKRKRIQACARHIPDFTVTDMKLLPDRKLFDKDYAVACALFWTAFLHLSVGITAAAVGVFFSIHSTPPSDWLDYFIIAVQFLYEVLVSFLGLMLMRVIVRRIDRRFPSNEKVIL